MNTVNNITYPQIQAIEPTEAMKERQQKHDGYRVLSLVAIVAGFGAGVIGAVNHLSSGFMVFAVISVVLGIILSHLAARFKVGADKPKENYNHSSYDYYNDSPMSRINRGIIT